MVNRTMDILKRNTLKNVWKINGILKLTSFVYRGEEGHIVNRISSNFEIW